MDDPSADMELASSAKKKKNGLLGGSGKKKKDRWALSEDARRGAPVPDGEYVGERKKKKEKKVKRRKKGGDGVGDDDSTFNSREVRLSLLHSSSGQSPHSLNSVPEVSLVQKSRNRKMRLVVFMENDELHRLLRLNRGI